VQTGTMKGENKQDIEWMRDLRNMSEGELSIMLHFQSCEPWRAMAISREINRRQTGTRQERQDKANDTPNEGRD